MEWGDFCHACAVEILRLLSPYFRATEIRLHLETPAPWLFYFKFYLFIYYAFRVFEFTRTSIQSKRSIFLFHWRHLKVLQGPQIERENIYTRTDCFESLQGKLRRGPLSRKIKKKKKSNEGNESQWFFKFTSQLKQKRNNKLVILS